MTVLSLFAQQMPNSVCVCFYECVARLFFSCVCVCAHFPNSLNRTEFEWAKNIHRSNKFFLHSSNISVPFVHLKSVSFIFFHFFSFSLSRLHTLYAGAHIFDNNFGEILQM